MATTKVSALAAKTSIAGSEELLINDGGTSKKVTATNLLAGATVADGSISTAKIADDAVTEAKLANAINTAIAANTAKTSNATHTGDVTGATELTIASGAVETGMIADDAVTAAKLANSINTEIAANTAKVTNATHTGDVTGATALTIAADAVTTAKIADDNVTADKLANSINTDIATGVTANTTANAALPKAGGTMTGDLILGDNVKLEIGSESGGDLQLYHDGGDSYITDAGTGALYIASNEIKLTNAGASEMSRTSVGFTTQDNQSDGTEIIKRTFTPEFRNRMDAIIQFSPLNQKTIMHVVDKFISQLEAQLESKKIEIQIEASAKEWIAERGYDVKMGARPMERVIQEHIKKPLAEEILVGCLENGGKVVVRASDENESKSVLEIEYLEVVTT